MHYTESEIVTFVRSGACPQEQMRIAAQMNLCSEQKIYDILKRHNVDVAAPKRTVGRKPALTPGQLEKMKKLLESGLSINKVADRLGVDSGTVYYHSKKMGVSRNKKALK